MTGDDQTSEIDAVRGRLIDQVHQQVRTIEEAGRMTDMRATERLFEVISERSDDPEVQKAVVELQRRGDTLVHSNDLRLVSAAANHGREFGPGGDTDYTGFNAALARIESALGGAL